MLSWHYYLAYNFLDNILFIKGQWGGRGSN